MQQQQQFTNSNYSSQPQQDFAAPPMSALEYQRMQQQQEAGAGMNPQVLGGGAAPLQQSTGGYQANDGSLNSSIGVAVPSQPSLNTSMAGDVIHLPGGDGDEQSGIQVHVSSRRSKLDKLNQSQMSNSGDYHVTQSSMPTMPVAEQPAILGGGGSPHGGLGILGAGYPTHHGAAGGQGGGPDHSSLDGNRGENSINSNSFNASSGIMLDQQFGGNTAGSVPSQPVSGGAPGPNGFTSSSTPLFTAPPQNPNGFNHTPSPPPAATHAPLQQQPTAVAQTLLTSGQPQTPGSQVQQQQQQQPEGPPLEELSASEIVATLLKESMDSKVAEKMNALPKEVVKKIVEHFIENQEQVFTLSTENRGKVVTQAISFLKGEGCGELIKLYCERLTTLGVHRVGCVSLTRVYEALLAPAKSMMQQSGAIGRNGNNKPGKGRRVDRDRGGGRGGRGASKQFEEVAEVPIGNANPNQTEEGIQLAEQFIDVVLTHFKSLASDQFGNFVCSAICSPNSPAHSFQGQATLYFDDPDFFLRCCGDRFASHVVDSFAKNAPGANCLDKILQMFQDKPAIVTSMGSSDIANYPLQAIFEHSLQHLGDQNPHVKWAQENVPQLVSNSHHFPNITSSIGLRLANENTPGPMGGRSSGGRGRGGSRGGGGRGFNNNASQRGGGPPSQYQQHQQQQSFQVSQPQQGFQQAQQQQQYAPQPAYVQQPQFAQQQVFSQQQPVAYAPTTFQAQPGFVPQQGFPNAAPQFAQAQPAIPQQQFLPPQGGQQQAPQFTAQQQTFNQPGAVPQPQFTASSGPQPQFQQQAPQQQFAPQGGGWGVQ